MNGLFPSLDERCERNEIYRKVCKGEGHYMDIERTATYHIRIMQCQEGR